MTSDEIRAAIAADPELQALVPNTTALAERLSAGRVRLGTRMVNVGTVLDVLGPSEGAAVLDALDALRGTVSAVRWAFILLERNELDVALDSVRGQIDALTGVVFSPAAATALKALAERHDPVSEFAVRCAIYGDDGGLLV